MYISTADEKVEEEELVYFNQDGQLYGLAAIGGGSLAVGGLGMAGGTAIISAIAGGFGTIATVVSTSSIDIVNVKKHNKEIREELKRANLEDIEKEYMIGKLFI